ncbi:MAG: zinc ribbon domain-containing protein [Candidatus Aminicenantes bacterium]|nr:MAG: zinc ribbon domain-containing protein [Candidatus Aminicenantes bacterium]
MIKKIKKLLLTGNKLAEYYENNEEFYEAYKEYLKLGDHIKAGKILEKNEMWHEAANLYIQKKEIDLARRAIENCFNKDESWEMFEVDNENTISIEDWLKQNRQVRRFVRYVKHVETLNEKNIPLIVILANKLKQILEYKSAAELYNEGFELVNRKKDVKTITNEVWLRYAAECYSKAELYAEAAQCMKELTLTEVRIGDSLPETAANPYRNYIPNLKLAKEWNFLPQLVEILGDFDPFNISYDLLKIGEPRLSLKLFFKFYGKVATKNYSDREREIRNKKIQYCLNQYIIYYREKKEYEKAAEIALMDSQKEIAAELYQKAIEEKEKAKAASTLDVEDMETIEEPKERKKEGTIIPGLEIYKCPTCGEIVEPDWEICPGCGNVLDLGMCKCGQKIKPHWKRCPACQRILKESRKPGTDTREDTSTDNDTKPFKKPSS